jgi:ATP-dependent DNA helicase RecQ
MLADLQNYFGFTQFRPGQAHALESLLAGKNTLVVMPTGSGKSLIYQLASLHLPGITLVISPLIALMKDQVDQLEKRGMPVTYINSALSKTEQNLRLEKLRHGGYRMLYVAPERLRSLSFQKSMEELEIGLLAVDEAHCISEWGHDFRPDYLRIAHWRSQLGQPLTAALTATATPQVQGEILRLLKIENAEKIVTGFNRPNLTFNVSYSRDISEKYACLQKLMVSRKGSGGTIVYTGTRRDAEEVTEFLNQVCCQDATFYHAGLPVHMRTQVQEAFMSGKSSIVVATNAFGMGIDRADVRQVVHFSLPGSLEAYYQEAGRAGRDGLASTATLIYDPKDQTLQEFFIRTSLLSYEQVQRIYKALPEKKDKHQWLNTEDLSRMTGLADNQIRVGLSLLERGEALIRVGDEGLGMKLEKQPWDEVKIRAALAKAKAFQAARKKQLEQMIRYAESNHCRRRIVLDHFGDHGPAEAQDCCDNCRTRKSGLKTTSVSPTHPKGAQSQKPAAAAQPYAHATDPIGPGGQKPGGQKPDKQKPDGLQPERIALIILDALRRSKLKIGRTKLAQLLHGSQAIKITQAELDKHIYYARLQGMRQSEIIDLIDQLTQAGYFKMVGGQYPVLQLTPQGEMAIQQRQEISINLPKRFTKADKGAERGRSEIGSSLTGNTVTGNTVMQTETLFQQGCSPAQIAEQRGLSLTTIYGHLSHLVAKGGIDIRQLVTLETQQKIEAAIRIVGSTEILRPIKDQLPEEISFGEIRCVIEERKRQNDTSLAQRMESNQNVEEFLHKSIPRQLFGPWQSGWALGFHSSFSGSTWQRSQVGEWTYRLKYKEDASVLPDLVAQALALAKTQPELLQVDVILPVPPSQPRSNDPVRLFAQALAQQTGLKLGDALVKSRQTQQQKTFSTLAQKKANVSGAFGLTASVKGLRLLVVDDLFDSGCTLLEIFRVLEKAGPAAVHVLTLTRTIHTER